MPLAQLEFLPTESPRPLGNQTAVLFPFSKVALSQLENLLTSDVRHHVVSFTYVVPELLKTDILDLNCFKSEILTPNSYVDQTKALHDDGYPTSICPSYMAIYEAIREVCEEQYDIIHSRADLTTLSSVLGSLPKLRELTLSFCEFSERETEELLSYLDLVVTMGEKSHGHHVRVAADAVQSARDSGVSVQGIHLHGFELPYGWLYKDPELGSLPESLSNLLSQVHTLCLTHSGSAMELLSRFTLNLGQFDMCHVHVERASLRRFLGGNMRSSCSVGFHDVRFTDLKQLGHELPVLSPESLCSMLGVSSTLCRPAAFDSLPCWEKGWRLLLKDDCTQRRAGEASKRKFDEI
ncbi:hypothetical protein LOZ65_004257 [Ophidiomyces ophidiicola]|nr:hypothetical protein LOZ65_004257 [Ophidiomyces ophidiicola]